MKPRIEIDLTPEQAEALRPYFDEAVSEFQRARPGMLLAQVVRSEGEGGRAFMRVAFISHETAKLIRRTEALAMARARAAERVSE